MSCYNAPRCQHCGKAMSGQEDANMSQWTYRNGEWIHRPCERQKAQEKGVRTT